MSIERGAISIGILAGGRSRRMGADKALLTVDGETMLERAVTIALGTGLPVAVSGRDAPETWTRPSIPFIHDLVPFTGPLHGIVRLLEHFRSPLLAFGCDMPLMTPEALAWLIEEAGRRSGGEGVAVLDGTGVIQPLFSIYTPAILARSDLAAVERSADPPPSARAVIETGRFERITIPEELEAALRSVDTPADCDLLRGGSASNRSASSI